MNSKQEVIDYMTSKTRVAIYRKYKNSVNWTSGSTEFSDFIEELMADIHDVSRYARYLLQTASDKAWFNFLKLVFNGC